VREAVRHIPVRVLKEPPFPVSPKGKAGVGEGSPHAAKTMRLPPNKRGFNSLCWNPPYNPPEQQTESAQKRASSKAVAFQRSGALGFGKSSLDLMENTIQKNS
jgi:hypothetical protein